MIGRRRWLASAAAAVAGLGGGAASAQVPSPGRYDAQLCVANPASQPPTCGAAEFIVLAQGRARVRVADIVYRLRLRSSQLDVVAMHGAMQIDEFSTDYAWSGNTLVFADPEKGTRYEVRPGAKIASQ